MHMPPDQPANGVSWGARWVLLTVLALQALYFATHVRAPVLYRDEANDYFTATASWPDLARQFVSDWDPYVSMLAERAWVAVFGGSEFALRGLSCASFMLATFLMFRLARGWFRDEWAAAAAATFFGTAGPMLSLSIGYARPYAMASLTSVWVFLRLRAYLEQPDARRLAWFALAAVCFGNMVPGNYAFAAALVAWGGVRMIGMPAPRGRDVWARHLVVIPAVLGLAALPSMVQALRFASVETGMSAASTEHFGLGYFAATAYRMLISLFGPLHAATFYATDDNPGGWMRGLAAGRGWLAPALLAPLLVVMLRPWLRDLRQRGETRRVLEALLLFAVPIVLLTLGSFRIERLVAPHRAHAAMAIGACLLVVGMLRGSRALVMTCIALVLLRTAAAWTFHGDRWAGRRSDARDAAEAIASQAGAGDLVVLSNPAIGPTFHYYYRGPGPEIALPYDHPVLYWNDIQLWRDLHDEDLLARTLARLEQALAAGERVWFVLGGVKPDFPIERWEPYYAPAAVKACREIFAARSRLATNMTFATTAEPYQVELYIAQEPAP